jgi:hypothetical protein
VHLTCCGAWNDAHGLAIDDEPELLIASGHGAIFGS